MKFIIGLALNYPLNRICNDKIINLIKLLSQIFAFEVIIIGPSHLKPIFIPERRYKFIVYEDDKSLFDFSRYNAILNQCNINNNDILFAFNDTLGNGRKFNIGLFLYLIIAFFLLFTDKKKKFNIFAPFDRDQKNSWVCPYFFIGRVDFLRSLNFIDWKFAYKLLSKGVRRELILWLNSAWRNSEVATKEQRNIKFKTLVLEKALIKSFGLKSFIFMFTRFNIFRIINAISI